MSKYQRRTRSVPPIAILICVAFTVIAVLFLLGGGSNKKTSESVKAGVAYLELLERGDPAEVVQIRKDIAQKKIDDKRDALLEQLNNGTMDPFSLFQDYVLMGDSRAVGFWYRKFLDKNRVLADGGHTIRNIEKQMDQLVSLNPSMIFLCYGLNDTSIGYWNSAEEYTAEYMQVVDEIREKLPDATIVVSSILPARDPAFNKSKKWYNIPDWSAALGEACKENGVLFANCDQLAVDYPNLWDPDGIHFRKELYPYWASSLVVTLLMEDA